MPAKKSEIVKTPDPECLTPEEMQACIDKLTFQLDQANMQLDQFAHTISHEFQEPLRKIMTFSRTLQQDDRKLSVAKTKEYHKKIDLSAKRLRALVEDTLNFTNVTNYEKLFITTDLNVTLANVLFDFELLIEEKKAKIKVHKLPEIEAVPFQMNQLFYDIIHNSLKFSKADVAPIIEISAKHLTKKEIKLRDNLNDDLDYFQMSFKDNGIGFDQKYASQIFTMFQRLSVGGNYAGTGIGLAICKKVVKTYHGEIFAESAEGKGATIHVLLPVDQPKKLPEDIPTILKTWV